MTEETPRGALILPKVDANRSDWTGFAVYVPLKCVHTNGRYMYVHQLVYYTRYTGENLFPRSFTCIWSSHIARVQSKDQPGKVANPARGQLNRENKFPCPRSRLRIRLPILLVVS